MGLDVRAFSQQEWITAVTFALMVAGWIFGNRPAAQYDHVAFMGFGVLLFLGVITLDDITRQGDTLVTVGREFSPPVALQFLPHPM